MPCFHLTTCADYAVPTQDYLRRPSVCTLQKRRSPAVSGGAFINLFRIVSKAYIAVSVGNHLLFLRQVSEVIAFGRLYRSVPDIALDAINRPTFFKALNRKFVADVMKASTELCLLRVIPEQARRATIVAKPELLGINRSSFLPNVLICAFLIGRVFHGFWRASRDVCASIL
ncbi:hypothetical protein FHS72_003469 [Loktanella ponticola]|uniref:Uncharacterized protein n=1 Tax=Yoonia ponticola TaxID=1524255 RepID=A0A7W9BPI8_9RHOB|nr:hypothetical protein [Yoonia ponticola]